MLGVLDEVLELFDNDELLVLDIMPEVDEVVGMAEVELMIMMVIMIEDEVEVEVDMFGLLLIVNTIQHLPAYLEFHILQIL